MYVVSTYQGGVRIMYHIRTTWYQLVCTWYEPAPKIRVCRYLRTRATPPPKKEQNAQHTYQHVCTWYQPAHKIRICRYLFTRATSPPQKRTEGLLMKLLQKKQNINHQPKYRALPSSSTKQSAQQRVREQRRQSRTIPTGLARRRQE